MSTRKVWPTKEAARAFLKAYEKRVDIVIKKSDKTEVIPGPRGLRYWAAHDFVFGKKAAQ